MAEELKEQLEGQTEEQAQEQPAEAEAQAAEAQAEPGEDYTKLFELMNDEEREVWEFLERMVGEKEDEKALEVAKGNMERYKERMIEKYPKFLG